MGATILTCLSVGGALMQRLRSSRRAGRGVVRRTLAGSADRPEEGHVDKLKGFLSGVAADYADLRYEVKKVTSVSFAEKN